MPDKYEDYEPIADKWLMPDDSIMTLSEMGLTGGGGGTIPSDVVTLEVLESDYYDKNDIDSKVNTINSDIDSEISQINADFETQDQINATVNAALNTKISTADLSGYTPLPSFTNHCTTDRYRWQDAYNGQKQQIEGDAKVQGMSVDYAHPITNSNNTQTTAYTVTNDLGGMIMASFTNTTENDEIVLYINGVSVYDSSGLSPMVTVTKYFRVDDGDKVFFSTAGYTMVFYAFLADPNSQMQQMLAAINNNNIRISNLQDQINDLEAGINSKTIAGVTPIDITNQSYTVNNALGARVTGQGDKVLGLLGIAVASTGTCTFNPLPAGVQNYNNTALLSGDAAVFSYNVPDGTVITSSGMSYVTVYNYITG